MSDILAEDVKVVKWIFVGIKRNKIVNLQWGISITVDDSESLARVVIRIFGHGSSDLYVGDIGSAEDRFERIAQRLGAVDLLAEEASALPTPTAGQRALETRAQRLQRRVLRLAKWLKAIRAPAVPLLVPVAVFDGSIYSPRTIEVPLADLCALRDALEGAEGVDDDS